MEEGVSYQEQSTTTDEIPSPVQGIAQTGLETNRTLFTYTELVFFACLITDYSILINKDINGLYVLHYAAEMNNVEAFMTIHMLTQKMSSLLPASSFPIIKYGLSTDLTRFHSSRGETPIHVAVNHKSKDIV